MDGANLSDGGDGDSAAKDANHVEDGSSANLDYQDAERMHAENAKRFKISEEVVGEMLDEIGLVIDGKTDQLEKDEHVDKGKENGSSESTSSSGEASTSSGNNPNNEEEMNNQESKSSTTSSNDHQNEQNNDENEPATLDAIEMHLNERLDAVRNAILNLPDGDDDDASNSNADDDIFENMSGSSGHLSDSDSDDDDIKPEVLQKPKPKHNWFIVPALQNRQFGTSANRQAAVQFQQRCCGSLHCVERLELMYKLDKHTGCVNSINFHPNGTLLASGSDDLEIVIWDWKLGNPLLSYESKHRSNVFQTKFMPLSGNDLHIVSCARDGQVRLAQISAQEGLRSTRKLGSHKAPSHKLAVLYDQPQVVISVGEDGLVLKHDLRCPKSDKVLTVLRDETDTVALYSVSSNPIYSNEYCVAGRDYRVRTYDLRKGNKELAFYHAFDKVGDSQKHLHITCAVYNHNGCEILASYNDEDIYLFDTKGGEGSYIHSYQGHRNGATIKGVSFFGPKSEFIISGSDCGYVYFWERESEAIVQFLRADDNGVVNCLEPHPQLPFLCTSGLDRDIKVWVPSYEEDPKMPDLADTVVQNMKERTQWSSTSSIEVENARILWMLWRQFNTSELLRRMEPTTEGLSNHLSSSDSNSSSSSDLTSTSSASEHLSDDNDEGPGGCSPS